MNAVLVDSRDDRVAPSAGELVDLTLESYGWPGSSCGAYLKGDLALQKHWNLSKIFARSSIHRTNSALSGGLEVPKLFQSQSAATSAPAAERWFGVPADVTGCVASFALNLGAILPLGFGGATSSGPAVPLSDRYTLGGPFSLRGFNPHSVGNQAPGSTADVPRKSPGTVDLGGYDPESAGRALGGCTRSSLLMAISVPVPVVDLAKAGGRAFLFANVGSLGNGLGGTLTHCFGSPRASVGGGFAINFASQARIEVTYAVPVLCTVSDNTSKFQFGIGLTIM
jgi:outer membrane protein assembly factor BamA